MQKYVYIKHTCIFYYTRHLYKDMSFGNASRQKKVKRTRQQFSSMTATQVKALMEREVRERRMGTVLGLSYRNSLGQASDCTSDLRQQRHSSAYLVLERSHRPTAEQRQLKRDNHTIL